MMQALKLDFCDRRRSAPWIGRVLLAGAACVAFDAGLSYQSAANALRESQARVAKRPSSGPTLIRKVDTDVRGRGR